MHYGRFWRIASIARFLKRETKLKIVANMAVGYNNIDLEAAKEHDVIVTNTPGVLTETTADLAFALLLATARKLISAENEIRKGNWNSWAPMRFTGMDVGGATLGIIGMGRIGEAVARRAKGFDMTVLYHNRNRKPDAEAEHGFEFRELDALLKEADFVIILAPFTPETAGDDWCARTRPYEKYGRSHKRCSWRNC